MIILKPTLNVVLSCRQCPRGLPPECRQHGVLLWVQEEQLLPQASSIPRTRLYQCSIFFYSFARIQFVCSFKCVSLAQTLLVQCPWIFLSCFLSYSTVSSIIQSDLVLAFTWAFILLITSMNWASCVQFSATGSFKNMHVWDRKESRISMRFVVNPFFIPILMFLQLNLFLVPNMQCKLQFFSSCYRRMLCFIAT